VAVSLKRIMKKGRQVIHAGKVWHNDNARQRRRIQDLLGPFASNQKADVVERF
jgi:hypothetical protein